MPSSLEDDSTDWEKLGAFLPAILSNSATASCLVETLSEKIKSKKIGIFAGLLNTKMCHRNLKNNIVINNFKKYMERK